MDELALVVLILLLLLAINQVAGPDEDEPDRIPNWEKRRREDKGLHDSPEDHTETPRQYRR